MKCTCLCNQLMAEYCLFHRSYMNEFLKNNKETTKPTLAFVYDLRNAEYCEWMTTVIPFVKLHSTYKNDYSKHLMVTCIIINSKTIQTILDSVLNTLYVPSRPVEIIHANDDITIKVVDIINKFR